MNKNFYFLLVIFAFFALIIGIIANNNKREDTALSLIPDEEYGDPFEYNNTPVKYVSEYRLFTTTSKTELNGAHYHSYENITMACTHRAAHLGYVYWDSAIPLLSDGVNPMITLFADPYIVVYNENGIKLNTIDKMLHAQTINDNIISTKKFWLGFMANSGGVGYPNNHDCKHWSSTVGDANMYQGNSAFLDSFSMVSCSSKAFYMCIVPVP